MLNLTRRIGERILIVTPNGEELEIVVTDMSHDGVKLGIAAPMRYTIFRSELLERQ